MKLTIPKLVAINNITVPRNPKQEFEIQRAIIFMAKTFDKKGLNSKSKSVVFHSIRVGMLLWQNGAPQISIMAGFLHDLLEDSSLTKAELSNEFGESIASIVEALSFDHSSHSYDQKLDAALESHKKTVALGTKATCIRACDLVDNSLYYHQANDPAHKHYLYRKYVAFMEMSRDQLEGTPFWNMLNKTFEAKVQQLV